MRDSELVVDHGRGEAVALGGACGLLLLWPWASFDVRGPPGSGRGARELCSTRAPPSASASRRRELCNARAFLGASTGRAGTQPPGTSSTAGGAQMHDAAAGRRALLVCHWTVKDVILAVVLVWSV